MSDSQNAGVDTTSANPTSTVATSNKSANLIHSIRGFLSRLVVNLALTTAILTVVGFFIVHSYLSGITRIFTYKVDPIVYVSSGINMFLGVFSQLPEVLQILGGGLLIGIGGGIIGEVFMFPLRRIYHYLFKKSSITNSPNIGNRTNENARREALFRLKISAYAFIGLVISLLVFLGINYGRTGYEKSPRYLGGGQPADVILIFSQPTLLPAFGFPISINATYPAQSHSVELLMELSDGVLVRDPQIQIPVIIKNELLYGMIDAAPPTPVPTATPNP